MAVHPVVYLVRHGQSEWNRSGLAQGQTAHPALTATGRAQAARAAELVAADLSASGLRADRLVTSDLVRATQTASILGDRLGLAPEVDVRLREQHLGDLQGRSREHAESRLEDGLRPGGVPPSGVEPPRQVGRRMAAALRQVPPAVTTVLVSHGDSIRLLLAHLCDLPLAEVRRLEVPNGWVARYDGDRRWPQRLGGSSTRVVGRWPPTASSAVMPAAPGCWPGS